MRSRRLLISLAILATVCLVLSDVGMFVRPFPGAGLLNIVGGLLALYVCWMGPMGISARK